MRWGHVAHLSCPQVTNQEIKDWRSNKSHWNFGSDNELDVINSMRIEREFLKIFSYERLYCRETCFFLYSFQMDFHVNIALANNVEILKYLCSTHRLSTHCLFQLNKINWLYDLHFMKENIEKSFKLIT